MLSLVIFIIFFLERRGFIEEILFLFLRFLLWFTILCMLFRLSAHKYAHVCTVDTYIITFPKNLHKKIFF